MVCRWDLMQEAGIEAIPTTIDEFYDCLVKLKEHFGDQYIIFSGPYRSASEGNGTWIFPQAIAAAFGIYNDWMVDEDGNVTCVYATYDPESRGGNSPDGRKVRGTIHWVSAKTAKKAEIRLYENIVDEEKGVYNEDGSINVNPNSLTVIKEAYVEPELEKYDKEDSFQFMRTGYFCLDSKDSTKEHMVFNRIVSLKSSYKPN